MSEILSSQDQQEFAIDILLAQFRHSVESTAADPNKYSQMLAALKVYNPSFEPVFIEGGSPKAKVLANVVAGIYAPLIHAYTRAIVNNTKEGNLPNTIIAPPRDAIPLANSLLAQSEMVGVKLQILFPHVNRNTAGVVNNQKGNLNSTSPHLELLLDQTKQKLNGADSVVELETGIYGTTSLVIAKGLKDRGGMKYYYPMKFYGLGPNLSFVHGILSDGKEWVAEKAEAQGLVDVSHIKELMVLLDTMEEIGMEKFYQSVEELQISKNGGVEPVLVPVTDEELEITVVTNRVIVQTAEKYSNITSEQTRSLFDNVRQLTEWSQNEGLPFTLKEAIPSMDSKENHFAKIRKSKLFDYPSLVI